jgi:hypothetical protein
MSVHYRIMTWEKKGKLFSPEGQYSWMLSHAQVPTAEFLATSLIRVYFGTRDKYQRTVTGALNLCTEPALAVDSVQDTPALGLGKIGAFDDSGAMPSWIVDFKGAKYLYYTGWNTGKTVPYRNSIGLALSDDNGISFSRVCPGPILDRSPFEPFFCSQPCVLIDQGCWRMWYMSCVSWHSIGTRLEPRYNIKYAESKDGIHWSPQNLTCIDFNSDDEGGIARPCVLKSTAGYTMWYCYRRLDDFRENRFKSYRIGLAVSDDGLHWQRRDNQVGLDISGHGWDSIMIAYPFVLPFGDRHYMFYNGNGFGSSGFGYALSQA